MRISLVLLFMAVLQLHAETGYAQKTNVSISMSNASIEQVLNKIEETSDYVFLYNDKTINTNRIVSVNNKGEILNILDDIFRGTNVVYSIVDNQIILSTDRSHGVMQDSEIQIKGLVKDSRGEPLIGVNVKVKETAIGVTTDLDGKFVLQTKKGVTLEISYIGYATQQIKVGNNTNWVITMLEDNQVLDEVVVTALGIKRAEKALSYNVQQLYTDAITSNKDVNFVNSLNGKVAGVNINTSSSGVGGVSKVVMRGTKSIMQTSNALYVIDGIPILSGRSNKVGGTEFDSQGSSEPIADINPEDIESISVLTGAAAAALYGSEAANGAIIVTTKKGKEGRLSLTVSSSTEFTTSFVMPSFQNRYGTGTGGVLSSSGALTWGTRLTNANNYGYNPKDDYFQTGIIGTQNISLSTGTEKNQTYVSAAAVNSKGIIPNNQYNRYNFTVRNTTSFLNDKMKLDVGVSYILQNDRNMTNQGSYNNPLVGAYLFPRGNDWEDIQMYERYDLARKINTQYWSIGDEAMAMQNPYWINYRNLRENKKDRYMMNAGLNYQIADWLNISGRVRVDHSNNNYTEKFYASTNTQLTEKSSRGLYGIAKEQNKQLYADFLVSVNKSFGEYWSLQANLGGSISDVRTDAMRVRGPIADGSDSFTGEQVGLTNFFAIQNLSASKTKRMQEGWREQTQALFASAELGYKSIYYLTVTGRNDWPSQLAGPKSVNSSFFYPSVGASVVLSELMPNLNKDYLSYIKIRASWASVGNPFSRYAANPHFPWVSSKGGWSELTDYPMYDLKPERTNSWEFGLSMRLLKHFKLDVTYYNAKTMNQTFNPDLPVSGFSKIYIQTGAVRNSGIELSLGYNNTWNGFTWDTGITFSANKNKILTLANDAINPATGERISLPTLNMGGLGETRFLLKEGGGMGDLYSLIDLKRDANGKILIDANGKVTAETIKEPGKYIKLGSVLPKGNLAWRNSFSWRNFNAGFLVAARLGGVVFSRTQAMLDYYGVSKASADARDLGYVLVNGNDYLKPEIWYSVVGSGTAIPQYYTYSATNVRLQEASFGYTFPRKMVGNICDIKVSLVGRNLWLIYNKSPFDPEGIASTDNFYQGIDYFMMPSLRNIGFNLSFKF